MFKRYAMHILSGLNSSRLVGDKRSMRVGRKRREHGVSKKKKRENPFFRSNWFSEPATTRKANTTNKNIAINLYIIILVVHKQILSQTHNTSMHTQPRSRCIDSEKSSPFSSNDDGACLGRIGSDQSEANPETSSQDLQHVSVIEGNKYKKMQFELCAFCFTHTRLSAFRDASVLTNSG